MPDYTRYSVKVSALTPVHIGSGETLLYEYDYAVEHGKTWRINDAALLEAQPVEDAKAAAVLARTPPAQLLNQADFKDDSSLFRYVIRGAPRSQQSGAQLQEQLKDTFDRPYLPGASLKGALRTVLAWYAWKELRLKPEVAKLGQRREWAAQTYEHEIFGRDPNHDFLRALQVEDSQPLKADRLVIINVDILNLSGTTAASSIPVELEAIRGDTVFQTGIKMDWVLYSDWAKSQGLKLSGEGWLRNLAKAANERARVQIQGQLDWLKKTPGVKRLTDFYNQLANANLGENVFLLQLGWGTGWEDKTFGSHLQDDPAFMERLLRDYRLARGKRQAGDPFPKSRRVVVHVSRSQNGKLEKEPLSPLGWVLVEMAQV